MEHFLPEELIGKYLSDDITSSEKQALFAWMEEEEANKKFFEEVVKIWSLSSDESDFETDTQAAWAKVESRLGAPGGAVIRPINRRARWRRIAAAMLLLVIAGWWLMTDRSEMIEVIALGGEVKEVVLPDGSHVWLNENSRLTYNDDFSPRNIDLSGEAFFEVERDEKKPFTIFSGDATTQVLGTSFNIKAYEQLDSVVVTVKTGKVSVKDALNEQKQVILIPGDIAVVYKKEHQVKKVVYQDENVISWKTKKLYFNNITMKEIVRDIETYFGVQVEVENQNIMNCRYLGKFNQPQLDEILDALVFAMDLQVEKSNDTIIIRGKGCKVD